MTVRSHFKGKHGSLAMMRWILGCVAAMSLVVAAPAQNFPERTIRLVVPVPPGGSTDALARLVAARMHVLLGQAVIIENQPGAGGVIAARAVAASRPDGYTLLIGGIGTFAIAPSIKSPDFDPLRAFTPIGTVSTETMVLVVNPKVPATTLATFIGYAKEHPGKLNYGAAPGIVPHFVSELFKLKSGTDIVHIPYKGAGPVVTDLIAGQIDMAFNTKSVLLPLVRQERLRALAVTSAERWPELPQLPTFVEAGVFADPVEVWWGIAGPAGLPGPIVERLNAAVRDALRSDELRATFATLGIEPRPSTPDEFAALLARDAPRWFDIIRTTGIKLE
jgi:tripartite-type tricarboxylate transporter receptor subunit TctC